MLTVEFSPALASRLALFHKTKIVHILAAELGGWLLVQCSQGTSRAIATGTRRKIEPFEDQTVGVAGDDVRAQTRQGLVESL